MRLDAQHVVVADRARRDGELLGELQRRPLPLGEQLRLRVLGQRRELGLVEAGRHGRLEAQREVEVALDQLRDPDPAQLGQDGVGAVHRGRVVAHEDVVVLRALAPDLVEDGGSVHDAAHPAHTVTSSRVSPKAIWLPYSARTSVRYGMWQSIPPSTSRIAPVTNAASSEAR